MTILSAPNDKKKRKKENKAKQIISFCRWSTRDATKRIKTKTEEKKPFEVINNYLNIRLPVCLSLQ